MKNEVLLRYKRARWHSVIEDSSIQRGGAVDGQKNKPTILPLSLDGRGIKGEGEQDNINLQPHGQPTTAAHVTNCTRTTHTPSMPILIYRC